jgi:NADPH:quinone reductase-like Zn-dependent oxidoreductase
MSTAAIDPAAANAGNERGERERAVMDAVVQRSYGADPATVLELARVERPAIGDGEVLVKVAAASVDMGTWHCMTGMPYAMRLAGFGVRAPRASNPGRAFAGTVEAVGRDAGTAVWPGDEVFGTCDGSFAGYVLVDPTKLARKPANVSFEQASTVPISGVTALQALDKADVRPGQAVLVTGASGGVGAFAVQIAKARGAEVTGVCSTAKIELVRSLGADHVIDRTVDDFVAGEERYDVIIDTGGNRRLSHLRRVMTETGTLVIVGSETGGRWLGGFERSLAAALVAPFVSQALGLFASKEDAASLDGLRDLIEAGQVTPVVDRTYPLAETADAIDRMRSGAATGKVVITT